MSKAYYEYDTKIVINRTRTEVIEAFMDYQSYHDWQPSLLRIEPVFGTIPSQGHILHLVYQGQNGEMVMEERLTELSLPHKVVQEYRLGTTKNVQHNYFESFGAKTMWTIHTEFFFEQEPPYPQEIFASSTKQSLTLFKDYVESN